MTVDQPLDLTVVGGMVPLLRESIKSVNKAEHKRCQRLVDAAARKLRTAGLRAKADVFDGDAKKVLVEVAEEWRADCIFLGATGLSNRLEKFLHGSTAGAVASRAHCSVEVVRTRRRKRRTNGNGNGH